MNNLDKAELAASVRHVQRFAIRKYETRLTEKREEKEHRQLQSVLRFTQTQKDIEYVLAAASK